MYPPPSLHGYAYGTFLGSGRGLAGVLFILYRGETVVRLRGGASGRAVGRVCCGVVAVLLVWARGGEGWEVKVAAGGHGWVICGLLVAGEW